MALVAVVVETMVAGEPRVVAARRRLRGVHGRWSHSVVAEPSHGEGERREQRRPDPDPRRATSATAPTRIVTIASSAEHQRRCPRNSNHCRRGRIEVVSRCPDPVPSFRLVHASGEAWSRKRWMNHSTGPVSAAIATAAAMRLSPPAKDHPHRHSATTTGGIHAPMTRCEMPATCRAWWRADSNESPDRPCRHDTGRPSPDSVPIHSWMQDPTKGLTGFDVRFIWRACDPSCSDS